jgi:murein DD-endopeptidase MepM/ murein hydrolase activator NlpD
VWTSGFELRFEPVSGLEPWVIDLDAKSARWLVVASVLAGAFVVFGLLITPELLVNLWNRSEYESLIAQRSTQGQRLQSLVDELENLSEGVRQSEAQLQRIYLAYGFDLEAAEGKTSGSVPAVHGPSSIYSPLVGYGNEKQAEADGRLRALGLLLDQVEELESTNEALVRLTPSVSPLESNRFVLTSAFGSRRSPFTRQMDFHTGLDLAAARGTPVRAPADGVVAFAGRYQLRLGIAWWRYGNLVSVRHGDEFVTLFGHLEEIEVRNGQRVKRGDLLGTVGDTGWSTNPHLHFEVRRLVEGTDYRPVDPRLHMLDHSWRDDEQLLVRELAVLTPEDYEPLPRGIRR